MLQGPNVDIYVGPNKKHFVLPKLLLCHYSKYFERCFNGGFKEAETQELALPEDEVYYFEALLEVMLQGKISEGFANKEVRFLTSRVIYYVGDRISCRNLLIKKCLDLLRYADKYDLGALAADIVYDPLYFIWLSDYHDIRKGANSIYYVSRVDELEISEESIEVIYAIAPVGHRLRELVIRTVARCSVREDGQFEDLFPRQKKEVEGFAEDLLDFLTKNNTNGLGFRTKLLYGEAEGICWGCEQG